MAIAGTHQVAPDKPTIAEKILDFLDKIFVCERTRGGKVFMYIHIVRFVGEDKPNQSVVCHIYLKHLCATMLLWNWLSLKT